MQEEQIQALNEIGLSTLQAKIYLCLVKLGEADVGTISKASSLARQDVYRVMPSLEKLGLAEKILTKPVLYKATSIKEGVSILLQKRQRENDVIQRKASSLMQSSDSFLCENDNSSEPQFKITSEETLLFKMHSQLIEKAQRSIDILISTNVFEDHSRGNLFFLKRAAKRGVKVRLIVQKNTARSVFTGAEKAENDVMEIRYSSKINTADMLWFGMHVFDRKETTMCVSMTGCVPSLWSNSPSILELAESYFEALWAGAVPYAKLEKRYITGKAEAQFISVSKPLPDSQAHL